MKNVNSAVRWTACSLALLSASFCVFSQTEKSNASLPDVMVIATRIAQPLAQAIADGTATFGGMMLAVHGTATVIVILWYLHTEFNLHWRKFVSSPSPQNH